MALECCCIVIISSEILIIRHNVEIFQLKALECIMCSKIRLHRQKFCFETQRWRYAWLCKHGILSHWWIKMSTIDIREAWSKTERAGNSKRQTLGCYVVDERHITNLSIFIQNWFRHRSSVWTATFYTWNR